MRRYALMLTNLAQRVLDDFSARLWGNQNKACFLELKPRGGFSPLPLFVPHRCYARTFRLSHATYWVSKVIEVSLWYGVSHGLPTERGWVCSHQPCASLPLITYIPQGNSKPPSSGPFNQLLLSYPTQNSSSHPVRCILTTSNVKTCQCHPYLNRYVRYLLWETSKLHLQGLSVWSHPCFISSSL